MVPMWDAIIGFISVDVLKEIRRSKEGGDSVCSSTTCAETQPQNGRGRIVWNHIARK